MNSINHAILNINSTFSIKNLLIVVFMSVLINSFIFYVYTLAHRDYSFKTTNLSIIALGPICALLVFAMPIDSSIISIIVISIIVVGVTSLLFIHNKKYEDKQFYLLWSIACGVLCGNKSFIPSAILCVLVFVIFYALRIIGTDKTRYLIIEGNGSGILDIQTLVFKHFERKAKLIIDENNDEEFKLIYQIPLQKLDSLRNKRINITELINNIEGVKKALIVTKEQLNEQ